MAKPTAGSGRVLQHTDNSYLMAAQPVGVDMEGMVNSESVPTSLIQVADSYRNIFLFRYCLSLILSI